jgi:polyhydroxybutyrate depolymerase
MQGLKSDEAAAGEEGDAQGNETVASGTGRPRVRGRVVSGYLVRGRSDDKRGAMRVDGRERTYSLHVPAEYDGTEAAPLLLALHGRLGTGSGEERLAHLDEVSDEHDFLVVYPDGLDRSWADGRGGTPADRNQVDDVKFLSALIDELEDKYKIDNTRVYATSISNGGFMSGRLACELADKIAAVAIVGASLSKKEAGDCHPNQPVSVLIVQGTADPVVPFAGGPSGAAGARGVVLSHDEAVRRFVAADHCAENTKTEHIPDLAGDGTNIDVTMYGPCADGSEVRGYVVNGGGHTWPGGMQYLPAMFIGKTTRNLDGSEVIWEFLSRHERG